MTRAPVMLFLICLMALVWVPKLSAQLVKPVADSSLSQLPYSAVGIVFNGSAGGGTGSGFIAGSPKTLMTAAHIFYNDTGQPLFDNLMWQRLGEPQTASLKEAQVRMRGVWIYSDYSSLIRVSQSTGIKRGDDSVLAEDIAVVISYEDLGPNQVTLDVRNDSDPGPLANASVNKLILGFPSSLYWDDHPDKYRLHETQVVADDVFASIDNNFAEVTTATWQTGAGALYITQGMSGGPTLINIGGAWKVTAVNVADGPSKAKGLPGVRLITQDVVNLLLNPAIAAANEGAQIEAGNPAIFNLRPGEGFAEAFPALISFPKTRYMANQPTSNGTGSASLPTWLACENETGLLHGTPPTGTSGDFEIDVWAIEDSLHGPNGHAVPPLSPPPVFSPTRDNPGCSIRRTVILRVKSGGGCGDNALHQWAYYTRDTVATGGTNPLSFLNLRGSALPNSAAQYSCELRNCSNTLLGSVSSNLGGGISNYPAGGLPPLFEVTIKARYAPQFPSGLPTQVDLSLWQASSVNWFLLPTGGAVTRDQQLNGTAKVTLGIGEEVELVNLVYLGSDLDSIEIVGPDEIVLPTNGTVSVDGFAKADFDVELFYENAPSRMNPRKTPEGSWMTQGKWQLTTTGNGFVTVDSNGTGSVTFGDVEILATAEQNFIGPTFTLSCTYSDGQRTRTATKQVRLVAANQATVNCVTQLSTNWESFGQSGGSRSFTVTGSGCPWTASTTDSWITITGGASGSGNGTVSYSVAVNSTGYFRSGVIHVGSKYLSIVQEGIPLVINPTSASFGYAGGPGTVNVTAAPGYAWSCTAYDDWVGILSPLNQTGNGSVSYSILPNPMTTPRTAVIKIENYRCTITQLGNPNAGGAPEIAVEQPTGTGIPDGGSKSFGTVNTGSSFSLQFTIKNLGTANLTGLTISKDGAHEADFAVTASPVSPVGGPSGSTTFTVQFTPSATGTRSAAIHIANNDSNEDPFDISLTGTGAAPSDTTLPTVAIGTPADGATFVTSPVTVTGTASDNVGVTSVRLRVNGGAWGAATGTLSWSGSVSLATGSNLIEAQSRDAAGNSSLIASRTVTYNPPAPEIVVEQPAGFNLTDGSASVSFGNVLMGRSTSLAFTIKNTGNANLTGLTITKDGATPAEFTVTATPVAPVSGPTGSTMFVVEFTPAAFGTRTAAIHIASNDANENPFDIALSGVGAPSVVLPAPAEQNTGLTTPIGSTARTLQYVLDSSLLSSVNIGSQITGMAFRVGGGAAAWPSSSRTWTNYDVQISTSVNNPGSLSTTFSNNIGPDVVTVRSGPLTVSAGSYPGGVTPNSFGPEVAFTTPFVYTGGDLLITIRHTGNGVDHTFLDAATDMAGTMQGIYSTASGAYTATTSNAGGFVPVTLLDFVGPQVPELMYYRFDGTGASVANAASAPVGSNPSVIAGGMTQGGGGQFGGGLVGSGGPSNTDRLNTGWATNLSGSWTISLYLNNIQPSSSASYVFGDDTAGSFRCFTNGVAGANNLMLRGPGIAEVLLTNFQGVTPKVSHFVYDATIPEIRAYLNGELVNTVAQGAITITGGGPFLVGGYSTGTGIPAGGILDEFRMYNRALSPEEIANTWNVSLPGSLGRPEIVVEQPASTDLPNGGSRFFGSINVGSSASLLFTVNSTGTADLTGLQVTIDGANAGEFSIIDTPAESVSGPNGSTTFSVRFSPTTPGSKTASLHISSNDSDENPFDIHLTGTGVAVPEIVVEQPTGTNVADEGTRDFGSVVVGANTNLAFTIKNTGYADLSGLTVTKDGIHASDFTVTTIPVGPVAGPGGSTTFVVKFAPSAAGARIAAIHVASNDADEDPFDINLAGIGISNNPDLASLVPSTGSLLPSFSTGTTIYSMSVLNAVSSISVTPTTADTGATVKVNNFTVTSGQASAPISLAVGNNTINTVVTAEDGVTSKTYTLNVSRHSGASTKAQVIGPVNGSVLASTSLPLTWNAGINVTRIDLYVGTTPGGREIYSGNQGTALSRTVTVPANGGRIYVTLWSLIGGAWQSNTYLYISPAPVRAALTSPSPANGSTLSGGTLNLAWNAGLGVSAYSVYVGSTVGGRDIASRNVSAATTTQSIPVPQDGGPIYVTLWSQINGAWQSESYWFLTALPFSGNVAARLISPPNTIMLGGATATFDWEAGTGVTRRDLWVGSTPDGYDLYKGANEAAFIRTLNNLPGDGRRIYATLHSLIGGVWQSNAYYFTAVTSPSPQAAQLFNPVNGSPLADATLPLAWGTAAGAARYDLYLGSTPMAYDIYKGNEGLSTARTVTVPTDGRPIYLTLWSLVNSKWLQNNYWFTAANTVVGNQKARMNFPFNGSVLPGTTATFDWDTGIGVSNYSLYVGTTPGGRELYSATSSTIRSRTLTTLPTDGRKIYVTLWSQIGAAWQSNSYLYTAANIAGVKAEMTSPSPGATFDSATVTFTWNAGTGTQYWLQVGRTPGSSNLYTGNQGTSLTRTLTTMPTDGSPIYVKLQSLINGVWQTSEYIYTTALPP